MILIGGIVVADSAVAVQENTTDRNRTETTTHRNPDDYSEDGDLDAVEGILANQLTARLGTGAIQLSEGEYEVANEYVGEEYQNRLEQYVDVAGETGGESYEEDFKATGEKQSQLSDAVREYRDTKAEYETARKAGNEKRARELARELEGLSDEIDTLGGSVREDYTVIEAATGADLSEPETAIKEVTDDIQAEQETVRKQQFEETELTVVPERTDISFLEPLVAVGELRRADGTPISNEEVRLDVGTHTERVTTDSAGRFPLEYRPTNESLTDNELTVQYVPETQSAYLGDKTTIDISIEQSEPTISLDNVSSEVAYREEVAVAGELTAEGVPVDGVTLAVIVDDERIGTVPVRNGVFDGSATLPASVEDGTQKLRVRLPFEEQALAGTADTTNVTIRETESQLSVTALADDTRTLVVNGTLDTVNGDGISGERVDIGIDGVTVSSVSTEAGGTFNDTVAVPETVDESEVTVSATYDGTGSNLEPTMDETVVTIDGGDTLSSTVWIAGGFGAIIAIGLLVWWIRRSDSTDSTLDDRSEEQGTVGTGVTASDQSSSAAPDTVEALLERTSKQLSSEQPDKAVQAVYAAVREALDSRTDEQAALTHWEFYHNYHSDTGVEDELLYEITARYERAAFGRDSVSSDEAANALEAARRLCNPDASAESEAGD
ncbi:DUF4129 domain-containing protein (plasmid) [Natrinema pallidum]|uniref:DUF4129 domain-containing protein n=2 Tax=Natrinema pallidum TaxID=69527 RepID=A0A4P9TLX4_9EURY|nr:DUF4129 domain-containing protein [Natrinema pallidum]